MAYRDLRDFIAQLEALGELRRVSAEVSPRLEMTALCDRVLRAGGRLLVLEFSRVWKPLQGAYDAYSFNVLPKLGELTVKDAGSYRYLAESIRMHPDQETLKQMMTGAGLERVEYFNLAAGVVALHRGYKL